MFTSLTALTAVDEDIILLLLLLYFRLSGEYLGGTGTFWQGAMHPLIASGYDQDIPLYSCPICVFWEEWANLQAVQVYSGEVLCAP